jgi:hypothetical protein
MVRIVFIHLLDELMLMYEVASEINHSQFNGNASEDGVYSGLYNILLWRWGKINSNGKDLMADRLVQLTEKVHKTIHDMQDI